MHISLKIGGFNLGYIKKIGELEYDHVKFSTKKGGKVVDPSWDWVELPEAVKTAFRDYIY